MKDDTWSMPLAAAHFADAVPHGRPVISPGALLRFKTGGNNQHVPQLKIDHNGSRLCPGHLLRQHKLAAAEIRSRVVQ